MNQDTDALDATELLAEAQRLFLAKDLDGFADLFAENGTHELPFAPPGVPRHLEGREAIRSYLTSITDTPMELTGFDDVVVYRTSDPEVVVAEYVGRGVVVNTGKPYAMPYIQVLRARNGRIVTWRDYWSPLEGLRALGARGLLGTLARTGRARLASRRRVAA